MSIMQFFERKICLFSVVPKHYLKNNSRWRPVDSVKILLKCFCFECK